MTDSNSNKLTFVEMLRFGTPLLLTISIFLTGLLLSKIDKIDDKLFKHLTNAEIHTPRGQITEKGDFGMYVNMRNVQWNKLYDSLNVLCIKQDEIVKLLMRRP